MSVMKAIRFFSLVEADEPFRTALEKAGSRPAREKILAESALCFQESEIDQAYHSLLTQCQFENQARVLNDLYLWWKILNQ